MNIHINLVPDAILQQRREALLKRYATYALGGWLGLVAVIGLGLWGMSAWTSSRLQTAKDEQTQLNAEVNSEDNIEFRAEAQRLQISLDALATLILDEKLAADLLRDLSSNIPVEVTLSAIGNGELGISVEAFAPTYEAISSFIAALESSELRAAGTDSGYFTDILVGRVINSTDQDQVQFDMNLQYFHAGEVESEESVDESFEDSGPAVESGQGGPDAQ